MLHDVERSEVAAAIAVAAEALVSEKIRSK
jgi:hypothetical protein